MMSRHRTRMVKANNQTMPGKVIFRGDDDSKLLPDQEAAWLNTEIWHEMGSPEVINVTFEYGEIPDEDNYRSSKSGQYVTEKFAEENPDTTVHES